MAAITHDSSHNNGRRRHAFLDVRERLRKISGMSVVDDADTHRHDSNAVPKSTRISETSSASLEKFSGRLTEDFSKSPVEFTTSNQSMSPFFAKLPLEVRRIIYADIWRAHLGPPARIHIYAAARATGLMHAPCACDDDTESSSDDDPINTNPWPAWRGAKQPPDWFWHAWSLRLRWGRHWRCQEQVMLHWTSEDGNEATCNDNRPGKGGEKTPFLNVFQTCKVMYAEAMQSLFETVTLVFTASEDAYRFLVQKPHPYLSNIRQLAFSFSHHKDHLFLFRINSKHPQLSCCESVPIGWDLWDPLMTCVKEKLFNLRTVDIDLAHQAHGREEKFLRLLDAWDTAGAISVSKKVPGTRHVVLDRR